MDVSIHPPTEKFCLIFLKLQNKKDRNELIMNNYLTIN
jgi:hypothetical protein